jgi:TetR/AcrR family transcriptional regulator, fatty acid metabolism regulator protein
MRKRTGDKDLKIHAAALKEFATKGFAKAKIVDIATKAGIATGSVYLYFPSKFNIIDDIFSKLWGDLCDDVEELLKKNVATEELLTAPAMLLLKRLIDSPDLAQIYVNEHVTMLNSKRKMKWIELYHKFIEMSVKLGSDSSEMSVNETIHPFVRTHFMVGGIRHLLHNYIPNKKSISKADLLSSAHQIILHGLIKHNT